MFVNSINIFYNMFHRPERKFGSLIDGAESAAVPRAISCHPD
jgi:hypothetical protein